MAGFISYLLFSQLLALKKKFLKKPHKHRHTKIANDLSLLEVASKEKKIANLYSRPQSTQVCFNNGTLCRITSSSAFLTSHQTLRGTSTYESEGSAILHYIVKKIHRRLSCLEGNASYNYISQPAFHGKLVSMQGIAGQNSTVPFNKCF